MSDPNLAATVDEVERTLRRCVDLFAHALPRFNWGASALDAEALALLNEVPGEVAATIAKLMAQQLIVVRPMELQQLVNAQRNCDNAAAWVALMELCGHTQDGSQTAVRLWQDDATCTCHLSVGDVKHVGTDFKELVLRARDGDVG